MKKENKVKKIIENNFDVRMSVAIITYIIECGWDNVKNISDDEIALLEGENLFSKEFQQVFVRTARQICTECNVNKDFIPYIIKHLYTLEAPTEEVVLYQDVNNDNWLNAVEAFKNQIYAEKNEDLDFDAETDVKSITLKATLVDFE